MKKPILVVMAAGMGSRFGGLKQMAHMGPNGEVLLEYSIYDAHKAGFEEVVFIIKECFADKFKQQIGHKMSKFMTVHYAYQRVQDLPHDIKQVSTLNREKPWGTAHAVWCAREFLNGPFAVINADDYYGAHAYDEMFAFLTSRVTKGQCAMIGYPLKKTLSENGAVARGLCEVNSKGHLINIEEQTQIKAFNTEIKYLPENATNWVSVSGDTPVSMNLWGFHESFVEALTHYLKDFFNTIQIQTNMTSECYLPSVVHHQMLHHHLLVHVLPTEAQWFGVTYSQDAHHVQQQIISLIDKGVFPHTLF